MESEFFVPEQSKVRFNSNSTSLLRLRRGSNVIDTIPSWGSGAKNLPCVFAYDRAKA
jgi:hypothetical protein